VIWLQHWTDVLFLHFAVREDELESLLPPQLEIDSFAGQAWVSFVFFRLKLRSAGLPHIPGLSSLREMNVRTYVRHRGRGGIYFLRMYADNWLAIRAARLLTPLNYELATMLDCPRSDLPRHVECRSSGDRRGFLRAEFTAPHGAEEAAAASLDFWLVERYRLFVDTRDGAILAGDVEHPPWQASAVRVLAVEHDFGRALGLKLEQRPAAAHFSAGVAARFNPFRVVAEPRSASRLVARHS